MLNLFKPEKANWKHYFGSFGLLLLVLQFITGIILTIFYEPTYQTAYKSVQYLTNQVWGGSLSRNLHRWIAVGLFAGIIVHTVRCTLRKDFMNPSKKVGWMTGVLLVWPTFLLLYTGLILPWEWKGYWFLEMIPTYAATIPVMGPDFKAFFMRTFTLPRYLVVHILVLPVIAFILVDYHFLSKLRRRGIFRHMLKHTVAALPFIAALAVLSIYITIPSNDPIDIPLPLEGAYIPAVESLALIILVPFLYFKGLPVLLLAVVIPAVLFFAVAFMPYYLKGKIEKEDDNPGKKISVKMNIVKGLIVTVIVSIFLGLIYLGTYNSPTLGCNSCHNVSRGIRMGVPPDTFKNRQTLPNLDDDQWMMGHWFYPDEIF